MAKGTVTFEQELCKGCGLCVLVCPTQCLALNRSEINSKGYNPAYLKEPEKCIGCANCGIMCPDYVITVERF